MTFKLYPLRCLTRQNPFRDNVVVSYVCTPILAILLAYTTTRISRTLLSVRRTTIVYENYRTLDRRGALRPSPRVLGREIPSSSA